MPSSGNYWNVVHGLRFCGSVVLLAAYFKAKIEAVSGQIEPIFRPEQRHFLETKITAKLTANRKCPCSSGLACKTVSIPHTCLLPFPFLFCPVNLVTLNITFNVSRIAFPIGSTTHSALLAQWCSEYCISYILNIVWFNQFYSFISQYKQTNLYAILYIIYIFK